MACTDMHKVLCVCVVTNRLMFVGLLTVGADNALTLACFWDTSSYWVALAIFDMKAFSCVIVSTDVYWRPTLFSEKMEGQWILERR